MVLTNADKMIRLLQNCNQAKTCLIYSTLTITVGCEAGKCLFHKPKGG